MDNAQIVHIGHSINIHFHISQDSHSQLQECIY